MDKLKAFLKRKDIVFSVKRYFIDAMSAMAQGLFCTLLVGTILNTIGTQFDIGFLKAVIVSIGSGEGASTYTIGGLASAMVGPGMAVAIGNALHAFHGTFLSYPRGLCHQRHGRRRRSAGRVFCGHNCG